MGGREPGGGNGGGSTGGMIGGIIGGTGTIGYIGRAGGGSPSGGKNGVSMFGKNKNEGRGIFGLLLKITSFLVSLGSCSELLDQPESLPLVSVPV